MILILFIVLILFCINCIEFHYLKNDYKLLNPLSVIIYVWLFVLITHQIYFGFSEYTLKLYICILGGILSLAMGFFLFAKKFIYGGNASKNYIYNMKYFEKVIRVLTIIEIVRLIYMVFVVYRIAGSWETFLYNNTYVRNMYLIRKGGALQNLFEFFINANALLGHVLIGIYLAKRAKRAKIYIIIWTTFELAFAVITMSKMCFILYIMVVVVTFFNNMKTLKIQKRLLLKYMPLLAGCIFAFLLLVGKQRSYGSDGESFILVVFEKAVFYFSSPVEALGKYMHLFASDYTLGGSTLGIIGRILIRLGVIANKEVVNHAEFINVSTGTTNVYTWFRPFYVDFSYLGFVIVPFLLGCIAGLFYSPRKHNIFIDVCNSWISCVFALSFFNFMWGQTIYIFILIYAFLIHKLLRRKIYQKSQI